jgi:hypothetical protein
VYSEVHPEVEAFFVLLVLVVFVVFLLLFVVGTGFGFTTTGIFFAAPGRSISFPAII